MLPPIPMHIRFDLDFYKKLSKKLKITIRYDKHKLKAELETNVFVSLEELYQKIYLTTIILDRNEVFVEWTVNMGANEFTKILPFKILKNDLPKEYFFTPLEEAIQLNLQHEPNTNKWYTNISYGKETQVVILINVDIEYCSALIKVYSSEKLVHAKSFKGRYNYHPFAVPCNENLSIQFPRNEQYPEETKITAYIAACRYDFEN